MPSNANAGDLSGVTSFSRVPGQAVPELEGPSIEAAKRQERERTFTVRVRLTASKELGG